MCSLPGPDCRRLHPWVPVEHRRAGLLAAWPSCLVVVLHVSAMPGQGLGMGGVGTALLTGSTACLLSLHQFGGAPWMAVAPCCLVPALSGYLALLRAGWLAARLGGANALLLGLVAAGRAAGACFHGFPGSTGYP